MAKQTLSRKASDNRYYHKDFHIALNYGIEYLRQKFGKEAFKEHLVQFADALKGMFAINEHYEKIYQIEGTNFGRSFSPEKLIIRLFASPAVMHIKSNGHRVSTIFRETV